MVIMKLSQIIVIVIIAIVCTCCLMKNCLFPRRKNHELEGTRVLESFASRKVTSEMEEINTGRIDAVLVDLLTPPKSETRPQRKASRGIKYSRNANQPNLRTTHADTLQEASSSASPAQLLVPVSWESPLSAPPFGSAHPRIDPSSPTVLAGYLASMTIHPISPCETSPRSAVRVHARYS